MAKSCRARGFTLLEATIVSGMMGLFVVLVAASWRGLGVPLADAIAQCRVAQEANLAVAGLSRDFGGASAGTRGVATGKLIPDSSQFLLCYDDGDSPNGIADWSPPDTVIGYSVRSNNLIRTDHTLGTSVTIARNVHAIEVKPVTGGTQIKLTFKYRDLTRTYTLIARDS